MTGHTTRRSFLLALAGSIMMFLSAHTQQAPSPAGERQNSVLINKVCLFDGIGERLTPSNLLIEGRKIKQISSTPIATPPGAQVIDGGGRVLMPGLTDAHWHLTVAPNPPEQLTNSGLMYAHGIVNLLSGLSRAHLVCHTRGMHTPSINPYKNHRFPVEIISHAVWLYSRFCLSYRDVEELLFSRGLLVTYEAIRKWCLKFGQAYANQLRRRRPRPGDKWHLDEVFLTINGERHYLWRAVDQDGNTLDILVQSRRNKKAAKKFFRKLLKGLTYVPRVIINDQLKSYSAAKQEILPGVEHRQHRYLNNCAENSHQPTRQREWRLQGFKSPGHAQRFLSAYGPIAQHFGPRRHHLSASAYRQQMQHRFDIWQDLANLPTAA